MAPNAKFAKAVVKAAKADLKTKAKADKAAAKKAAADKAAAKKAAADKAKAAKKAAADKAKAAKKAAAAEAKAFAHGEESGLCCSISEPYAYMWDD